MNDAEEKTAKILIVDDHPATRGLISGLLQQLGYNDISSVHNGTEALAQLKKKRFDLVLSDWVMPEMDGLTLWNNIKEDESLKNTPFVLLTAVNEMEKIKEAISKGITDYIVKPITLQALTKKLAKVLNAGNLPK